MVSINSGYVRRKVCKRTWRNWWLVHSPPVGCKHGILHLSGLSITCPSEYVGKRVRLKVEVME